MLALSRPRVARWIGGLTVKGCAAKSPATGLANLALFLSFSVCLDEAKANLILVQLRLLQRAGETVSCLQRACHHFIHPERERGRERRIKCTKNSTVGTSVTSSNSHRRSKNKSRNCSSTSSHLPGTWLYLLIAFLLTLPL